MFGGAPSIYVDYTGYDALAHHVGPERDEAFDALDGLDRTIGSLRKTARETPRPYKLVVLSDHGQCLGTPFSQLYGELLEDVARRLMGIEAADPVPGDGEFRHASDVILGELGRGPSLRARTTRLTRRHRTAPPATASDPGELVACASGNLALLYLTVEPDRIDREEIDRRYPGLIPGLLAHPGVAFILVHSSVDGPVVLGRGGSNYLATGRIVGIDPLANAGPYAAESFRRMDAFTNAGDVCVIGPYDEASGEIVSYEELVGSHGGLGGPQVEPFFLHPADLSIGDVPLVGAPAVHTVLRGWLESLAEGAKPPRVGPLEDGAHALPRTEPALGDDSIAAATTVRNRGRSGGEDIAIPTAANAGPTGSIARGRPD